MSEKAWFTTDKVNESTYIISEYRHSEETHCYLLCGSEKALLIDTGLGVRNIYDEVDKLTDKPVTAVATHIKNSRKEPFTVLLGYFLVSLQCSLS